jgi:polysaccharide export outer membrane protein
MHGAFEMKHFGSLALFIGQICAVATLSACATEPLPVGNAAYALDRGIEYKLGPGDKVRINVFGEDQLSGEFIVANNGSVAVPLIGEVPAGGKSPTEFQRAVHDQIVSSGLILSPRVSADVIAYRPYYILGEVAKPGQYPYSVGLTLTKAVATAGGFTYRANSTVAFVTREGATHETPTSLTAASAIGPGDTVRIGERHF